ncbi:MAG: hypothetical protein AB1641_06805 [Thermodesulfobacteriota bacterium]
MFRWLKSLFKPPEPAGPPRSLRTFTPADQTISQDNVKPAEGGWLIEAKAKATVRLFEVPLEGVDNCMLTYRARMKTAGLTGPTYLEMWCRMPGRGEFFSKGLRQAVTGTTDWASYETPFFLKKGQVPDLIKLNLALEGAGQVYIKDVELLMTPLA